MLTGRAYLGQVPLRGSAPLRGSEPIGVVLEATGGSVLKMKGRAWFLPDADTRSKLEAAGLIVPENVETEVTFCNPTPGIIPELGNYVDPDTGLICFLDLPAGWNEAWMWGDAFREIPFDEIPAEAPYFVEYGGPNTGGKMLTAGPFDTAREAMDYGASRYGGSAPSVGHIQVKDALDRVAIIT